MKKIYQLLLPLFFNIGAFAQANLQTLPQVLFTAPGPVAKGSSSPIILDKIIELVDNTPANDTISMSIYIFNYDPLINALKNADNRGVILRLIIDNSREDSQTSNASTFTKLSTLSSNAEVIQFNSNASTTSINHTKFILFSKVNTTGGILSKVLLQTSHNFTLSESRKLQDALIFNHIALYNSFWKYFNDIKGRTPTGMNTYTYTEYNNEAEGIKACFFPRRGSGQPDNIIDILNSITDLSNATIKVGMSDWVESRINVAQKLTALSAAGARVEVVVKNKIDPSVQTELAKLNNTGGYLKMYNLVDDDDPTINIHAKFMVIEGTYNSVPNSKIIVTGSHNFTTNALRNNNEILMVLTNSPLFNTYKTYFDNIKYIDPPVNIAKWNFRGKVGNEARAAVTSTVSGITADDITRGSGWVTRNTLEHGFTSNVDVFSSASEEKAKTVGKPECFQFALNIGLTGSNVLALYTIDARIRRSANGNNKYVWAYSFDGTNYTDISSSTYTISDSDENGIFRPTVDLRSISELQALPGNTKIYFRLYAWGSTTSGGTFAFGKSANATEASLDISGVTYNVLPVSLSTFTAKRETNEVRINWLTQSEKNNAGFTLLKSAEGKIYEYCYDIAGQGNKLTETKYQYIDKKPFLGYNYYKLVQTDFNGQTEVYGPVAVKYSLQKQNQLNATAIDNMINVFVNHHSDNAATLSIYQINGAKIVSKNVNLVRGDNIFAIHQTLNKGVYIVQIKTATENITSKLIK